MPELSGIRLNPASFDLSQPKHESLQVAPPPATAREWEEQYAVQPICFQMGLSNRFYNIKDINKRTA